MKAKITTLSVLLGVIAAPAQLLVDFSNQSTPIAAGYQGYRAGHEVPADFTSQSFSAFGANVSILPTWAVDDAQSMQMIDRGTNDGLPAGVDQDLLRDWIGTDNRTSTGVAGGRNDMTLTITGLPSGTYRWLSYHHDAENQTGLFDVTVTDARGAKTTVGVNISSRDDAGAPNPLGLAGATKWITTITSDGVNPVTLLFHCQQVDVGGNDFFVMNGFELSFVGIASEWASTGDGTWSDANNWDSFGVPNGSDKLAVFGAAILAPSTVTVDIPVTLAGLNLNSEQSYTLAGSSAITLTADAGFSVDNGSHTISAPVAVGGGSGLTIDGAGELTLAGANTYTGPTVANISTLSVGSMANGGSPSAVGASSSDGANLTFAGTLRYVGAGNTSDRLFTFGTGTRTLEASGTGALNLSNPGILPLSSSSGARTLVLSGTNLGNNTLSAVVTDAGFPPNTTAITKNGPGRWVLAGANTSSGDVTVNQGTLALSAGGSLGVPLVITLQPDAVLDASGSGGLNLVGQVLQGSGSVSGDVTDGGLSAIVPGGTNVAGTLTFSNSLTLAAGGTIVMDLSSSTVAGGGVNDLIEVGGNLDLTSVNLLINFTGASLGNSYRLINYSGALVGTPNVTVRGLDTTRYTAIVTAAGGQVNLIISGAPGSLTWLGDGSANLWDIKASPNWTNPATGSLDQFNNLDSVSFTDLGVLSSNVDLSVALRPGSVSVNAASDYAFGGAGRLSGAMNLVKAGTGSLTLSNANDHSGTTTVSGGILRVANNAALGTSAGDTLIQSGGTLDVFGFQTSADHIYVAGTGAGGIGAIVNTRAEQQNAIRMLSLTADTLVSSDFRWDVRGAGGNSSLSGVFDLGGYTFSRVGTNRIAIVDSMATNSGNIVMVQGGMSLTRSRIEGPGYIDVGTNFVWIENSSTGIITKPMIFANGVLQCSGSGFLLHSFITNVSGLTVDASAALTISNTISGGGSLTKIGASIVRLEAVNSYAGDTTISAGTLALGTNGTLGGGAAITMTAGSTFDVLSQGGFTVPSGKTMTAAGTVNGSLTVANGAALRVGSSTNTGALVAVNGSVSLGGDTLMKLNATTKTTDLVSTTNTINLGGTLTVSVLTGTLAAGDTYKLFDAPVINGGFSTVNLPPLPPGHIWINGLAVDGTISVGALVLNAAQIPGGFLQFSWETTLNGLVKLQAQTNTLDIGLSTNWVDYPGGTFNGTVHVPDPANPAVFFRLSTQ